MTNQLFREDIFNERLAIDEELKNNAYPGRGIIIGKSANGKYAVTAYFIMGRSVNSRNRVFVEQVKESVHRHMTRQNLQTQVL